MLYVVCHQLPKKGEIESAILLLKSIFDIDDKPTYRGLTLFAKYIHRLSASGFSLVSIMITSYEILLKQIINEERSKQR